VKAVSEVTCILDRAQHGDPTAPEELLPLVYEELRRLATARMASEKGTQTLQPTALVHEAWLRLVPPAGSRFENRGHFFGAAAQAMRRILIENARRKGRLKRGGDRERIHIDEVELADTTPDDKLLLINEALERLQAADPDKARVVLLKFFGGLTDREVAESLGVTERTVERNWAYAKAWLYRTIRREL
jgi:RNA polymerase sigma factor (TIGR02999 family)